MPASAQARFVRRFLAVPGAGVTMLPRLGRSAPLVVPIPQPDGRNGLFVPLLPLDSHRGSQASGRPGHDNRSDFAGPNSRRERDTLRILFLRNEATILLKTKESAKKTKLTAYPLRFQGDNLENRTILRQHSHSRKGPNSGLFRSILGRSRLSYAHLCSSSLRLGSRGVPCFDASTAPRRAHLTRLDPRRVQCLSNFV